MSSFSLDGRARQSIALALFDGNRDVPLPPERETEARRLGLCGAEVDAARRGRSFDARMSRALALALAAASRTAGAFTRSVRGRFGRASPLRSAARSRASP